MPLPWVRLDSNIASNDKILELLQHRDGARAAWAYVCGMGYSAGHDTNGVITFAALPFIHCTKALAKLLVDYGLWETDAHGWAYPKWADRQQTSVQAAAKRAKQSAAARRTNCLRYHGEACGCWAKETDQ